MTGGAKCTDDSVRLSPRKLIRATVCKKKKKKNEPLDMNARRHSRQIPKPVIRKGPHLPSTLFLLSRPFILSAFN